MSPKPQARRVEALRTNETGGTHQGEVRHCISRVVNRDFLLGTMEREQFRELMREYEQFCGVRVLTYCVMFLADPATQDLYILDTGTGATTFVGPYGANHNIVGLAFSQVPEMSQGWAVAGLMALVIVLLAADHRGLRNHHSLVSACVAVLFTAPAAKR